MLHRGGISISGLTDLLATLRANPVGDSTSIHYLREANAVEFDQLRRVVALPRVGGGTVDWEFADPNKLLARAVERSPMLSKLYADALKQHPSSPQQPWRLIVGFDEFMPGQREIA